MQTKTFNLRVRHQNPNTSDIRELPEFRQLEQQINLFRFVPLQHRVLSGSPGCNYTGNHSPSVITLPLLKHPKDLTSMSMQRT